jgi:pimeloyl-ACP methyl ester carboxylesterase
VTPPAFSERFVDVGGRRVRYLEAGHGVPVIHVRDGAARVTPAHELLARHFRVLAIDMPDGSSRTPSASDLATTLDQVVTRLGIDSFNLIGSSAGAMSALTLALQAPARVRALILEAPTAIRPERRDADFERRLAALATPTLILLGTRDDVVPAAIGSVYKDVLPNSHLVFVYDAAHDISGARPEAFADVVSDFLERREAFVISRAATVIHP